MWCEPAQTNPQITASGKKKPAESPGGGPSAWVLPLLSSLVANPEVEAVFSTDLSPASRLLRNDAFDDDAIATPMAPYAYTSDPPACWIVFAALAGTDSLL